MHAAAEQLQLLRGMAVNERGARSDMSTAEVCYAMGWEALAAAVCGGCAGVDWNGMLQSSAGRGATVEEEEGVVDLRALAGGKGRRGKGGKR